MVSEAGRHLGAMHRQPGIDQQPLTGVPQHVTLNRQHTLRPVRQPTDSRLAERQPPPDREQATRQDCRYCIVQTASLIARPTLKRGMLASGVSTTQPWAPASRRGCSAAISASNSSEPGRLSVKRGQCSALSLK